MNNCVKISLRAARINAGLNQKEAADRLLIGTSTLQGYESGRRIPRWDLIQKMQEVYNIDCQYLKLTDS
ncbi:MAG: helix-turn-helix domain-containing protein [Oscillospiraceae bacterium]|jgi:transcriptional regulator with XRE-family HTH domain